MPPKKKIDANALKTFRLTNLETIKNEPINISSLKDITITSKTSIIGARTLFPQLHQTHLKENDKKEYIFALQNTETSENTCKIYYKCNIITDEDGIKYNIKRVPSLNCNTKLYKDEGLPKVDEVNLIQDIPIPRPIPYKIKKKVIPKFT